MARVVALLAAALVPAALCIRVERDDLSPPWTDHPAHLVEDLPQELLNQTRELENLQGVGGADLEKLLFRILTRWHQADVPTCWKQLGKMHANLTAECLARKPEEDFILRYYEPRPRRTSCSESAADIFLSGEALVEALQITRSQAASLELPRGLLHRFRKLSFLRSWLLPLAKTQNLAMLWTGFWEGDASNRTTMRKLAEFAKETEHATVHPDSVLGQVIEASENLAACYKLPETRQLLDNMWSFASMSFVLAMRSRTQGTVLALVNKALEGERPLADSVLFKHEVPTLGIASWGMGFWSPSFILVDLMGTCSRTSPAIRSQLFARLASWFRGLEKEHWSLQAFARRSRLHLQCIDCPPESCGLDASLAQHVRQLVEAKKQQDALDRQLREVLDPSENEDPSFVKIVEDLEMVGPLVPKGKNVEELQQGLEEALYSYIDAAPKKKEEDLEGQLEKVEQLLSAGACPNTAGPRGATPLSLPAFQGRSAVVDVLLQSRAQVGLRDSNGRTPLFLAEQGGHLQVVQMLLQSNAQVDSFDSSGRTPLLEAAEWGTSEMVDALLRSKAGVNFCDMHGNSPLSAAAGKGASEIVRMLLKSRAQVDSGTQQAARSKRCMTALDEAASHGHSEVVDLLVKSRAQVEPLVLLRAALKHQRDQVRVVDLLLESRAQVDRQTVTAVAKYGSPDVAALLYQHLE